MLKSVILFILLSLAAVVAVCFLAKWLEKTFPGKKYDEMQTISRLNGYRLAFLVGFLYYLVTVPILIGQVDGEKTIEPYLLVTGGVLLQLMVVHTYSLISHAALPLGENPLVSIGGNVLLGIIWMTSFRNEYGTYQDILHSDANSILQLESLGLTGHSSITWFYLALSICFFYQALLHTIQYLHREKE